MEKLTINDVAKQYSSPFEVLSALVNTLNEEHSKIDELYEKARYCREHNFEIEAKFQLAQAQQRNSMFISICNEVLGKYF